MGRVTHVRRRRRTTLGIGTTLLREEENHSGHRYHSLKGRRRPLRIVLLLLPRLVGAVCFPRYLACFPTTVLYRYVHASSPLLDIINSLKGKPGGLLSPVNLIKDSYCQFCPFRHFSQFSSSSLLVSSEPLWASLGGINL